MSRNRLPLVLWLLTLAVCIGIILRTTFTADMSAFLPQNPSAEQKLLVDQLKDGVLSRTLLIGIEGGDAESRAALSRALAQRMQATGDFAAIRNGAEDSLSLDRELLFKHRYLLSPAVTPERFSVEGLRTAINNSIDLLGSPAGMVIKKLLPHDPTGEMMELLGTLNGDSAPATQAGVWASRDGQRAILMAQTRAAGADTDAQQRAIESIRTAFAAETRALASNESQPPQHGTGSAMNDVRLLISGAPMFAVDARATIQAEVTRLSIICAVGTLCLLLLAYRSFTALALGLLPVFTGALAGIAAVSIGFGSVHGITIGFGTTLIGEAVDYSIYYFVQTGNRGQLHEGKHNWMERFWPTIRLGVLTSVFGFASLLLSSFPGLAQLGLYSIVGLVTAAAVTRYVLPLLHGDRLSIRPIDRGFLGAIAASATRQLARPGRYVIGCWLVMLTSVAALAVIVMHQDRLWNDRLSGLSPVSRELQEIDTALRADLGAPDMSYIVVVSRGSREAVLAAAEQVGAVLDAQVRDGTIGGYESAARFLPSLATQQHRHDALPEGAVLAQRLAAATEGLPLHADKLAPFIDDVAAARAQPLLDRAQLKDSSLALAVDSLLMEHADPSTPANARWTALMPLRASSEVADGAIDPRRIQQALDARHIDGALCVDIAGESARLYHDYLHQAIMLSLAGFVAIMLLLLLTLRSWRRVLRVLAPLAATVLIVIAALALAGEQLTLLHLVGMLLIVAVGSNYALFFDHPADETKHNVIDRQTLASLVLANLATLIGFGTLSFAQVPVLHAIGVTVGPGAVLALMLAAVLAPQAQSHAQ